MTGLLLALYPARWRRRYGEEFRAVLESRPLGPFDVADVVLGALDARLALRLPDPGKQRGGRLTMLRLGGYGAVIGGITWCLGIALASAIVGAEGVGILLFVVGSLGILLALVGLSAFQARSAPRLTWAAFVIPAAGTVISVVGAVGLALQSGPELAGSSCSPWTVWMIGLLATVIGSALFALSTIRANVLSRSAATALAAASGAVLLVGLLLVGTGELTGVSRGLTAITLFGFGGSWARLGMVALDRGPIRAIAPA